jgi:hypothetical protein
VKMHSCILSILGFFDAVSVPFQTSYYCDMPTIAILNMIATASVEYTINILINDALPQEIVSNVSLLRYNNLFYSTPLLS